MPQPRPRIRVVHKAINRYVTVGYQIGFSCKKAKLARRHQRIPRTALTHYTSAATPVEGHAVLAALKNALRCYDTYKPDEERSVYQKELHRHYYLACMRKIFKNDYARERLNIMRREGLDEPPPQEMLSLAPRRFGKTISVAMFLAAFLATVPGPYQVIVYSPGRRASVMLLQRVKEFLVNHLNQGSRILVDNLETISLQGNDKQDIRTLNAYPQKFPYDLIELHGPLLAIHNIKSNEIFAQRIDITEKELVDIAADDREAQQLLTKYGNFDNPFINVTLKQNNVVLELERAVLRTLPGKKKTVLQVLVDMMLPSSIISVEDEENHGIEVAIEVCKHLDAKRWKNMMVHVRQQIIRFHDFYRGARKVIPVARSIPHDVAQYYQASAGMIIQLMPEATRPKIDDAYAQLEKYLITLLHTEHTLSFMAVVSLLKTEIKSADEFVVMFKIMRDRYSQSMQSIMSRSEVTDDAVGIYILYELLQRRLITPDILGAPNRMGLSSRAHEWVFGLARSTELNAEAMLLRFPGLGGEHALRTLEEYKDYDEQLQLTRVLLAPYQDRWKHIIRKIQVDTNWQPPLGINELKVLMAVAATTIIVRAAMTTARGGGVHGLPPFIWRVSMREAYMELNTRPHIAPSLNVIAKLLKQACSKSIYDEFTHELEVLVQNMTFRIQRTNVVAQLANAVKPYYTREDHDPGLSVKKNLTPSVIPTSPDTPLPTLITQKPPEIPMPSFPPEEKFRLPSEDWASANAYTGQVQDWMESTMELLRSVAASASKSNRLQQEFKNECLDDEALHFILRYTGLVAQTANTANKVDVSIGDLGVPKGFPMFATRDSDATHTWIHVIESNDPEITVLFIQHAARNLNRPLLKYSVIKPRLPRVTVQQERELIMNEIKSRKFQLGGFDIANVSRVNISSTHGGPLQLRLIRQLMTIPVVRIFCTMVGDRANTSKLQREDYYLNPRLAENWIPSICESAAAEILRMHQPSLSLDLINGLQYSLVFTAL